jgi:hypothetical protein
MTASINASTSSGVVVTSDTSGSLALQSNGTTKFTVASTGAYGQITSGTAAASTSGTSIDFNSIPSWAKRITVMLSGVSTNGASLLLLQTGAGSITTSGYLGGCSKGATVNNNSTGFYISLNGSAGQTMQGILMLAYIGSNTWSQFGSLASGSGDTTSIGGGSIALAGTLDRVRITTVNGTDTFDAGTINILYEG